MAPLTKITIRPACADDEEALARLASLDSAAVPAGRLLLAEVDGELGAAWASDDGSVIANPYVRTEELIALLRDHAGHSRAVTVRSRAWFGLRRTLHLLGEGTRQQQLQL